MSLVASYIQLLFVVVLLLEIVLMLALLQPLLFHHQRPLKHQVFVLILVVAVELEIQKLV
jgi:hypothetical protein